MSAREHRFEHETAPRSFEEEIATWSGDVLREKQENIESMLTVAFVSLKSDEGPDKIFYTPLSETFWIKLGRSEEAEEARKYQCILQELDRRQQE